MSLRRLYHRHVRHHHRFNIAVVLTIVAVSWIVVPAVVRIVTTAGTYAPAGYQPRDIQRGDWLAERDPVLAVGDVTWEDVLKILLFIVAALAWLAAAPSSSRPGRSIRR